MDAGQALDTVLDEEHVDGRTLRRTRNRTAVIAALLAIIREGNLRPSASEIADRAGVSHRSIFRYFDDLDDLRRTAIDQAFSEARPLAGIPDIGAGSLEERVAAIVDARMALYESVDGTMQLARTQAPSMPSVDEGIAEIARAFRVQVAEHFANELAATDEADHELMVDAVVVLTSYESYTMHRRVLGSDAGRTRAAWGCALRAVLS
jgi:AcrR family transcriptional regulator